MSYWVVGGTYKDTNFEELQKGSELELIQKLIFFRVCSPPGSTGPRPAGASPAHPGAARGPLF